MSLNKINYLEQKLKIQKNRIQKQVQRINKILTKIIKRINRKINKKKKLMIPYFNIIGNQHLQRNYKCFFT